MAGTEFTPGPWHYDRDVGNDGDYIRETDSDACVAMVIDGGHINPKFALTQKEMDANARLIAAAPDLYKYLRLALDVINGAGIAWGGEPAAKRALNAAAEQVSA